MSDSGICKALIFVGFIRVLFWVFCIFFFFQAEDGIRDRLVTGVQTCALPIFSSLSILNYVDMDSEAEVLGYGISLILLNVGMYLGIPAIVIIGIRKRY